MKRAEILEQARKCVCDEREQEYGTPEDNFTTVGYMWSAYLRAAHPELQKVMPINGITSKDVAMLMSLLKAARIATGSSKADSFVDFAGYTALAGEIATQTREAPSIKRNEDTCVSCGATVPEGIQYCSSCVPHPLQRTTDIPPYRGKENKCYG